MKMLEYDRIDISEIIDLNKTNESKECMLCHYCFFLDKNLVMDHIFVMTAIIFLKNLEILKILLLFIFKKMQTEFIFYA